jgi:hypothetical protein
MTSGGAVKDSDALKTFNRSAPFKSFKTSEDYENEDIVSAIRDGEY